MAGLSVAAMILVGCSTDSSQVDVTQVPESQATLVNRCDEVIRTAYKYRDRVVELTEMINDQNEKNRNEPTSPENEEKDLNSALSEYYEISILRGEQKETQTLLIYTVADNPQCFSVEDVAYARSQRDALLNN